MNVKKRRLSLPPLYSATEKKATVKRRRRKKVDKKHDKENKAWQAASTMDLNLHQSWKKMGEKGRKERNPCDFTIEGRKEKNWRRGRDLWHQLNNPTMRDWKEKERGGKRRRRSIRYRPFVRLSFCSHNSIWKHEKDPSGGRSSLGHLSHDRPEAIQPEWRTNLHVKKNLWAGCMHSLQAGTSARLSSQTSSYSNLLLLIIQKGSGFDYPKKSLKVSNTWHFLTRRKETRRKDFLFSPILLLLLPTFCFPYRSSSPPQSKFQTGI